MGNIAPANYFVAVSIPRRSVKLFTPFHLVCPFLALFLALSSALTLSAAADPQSGATIQVQINDLQVREPKLDVRVSSEFVFRIQEVFRQRGYAGAVVGVTGYERPDPGCYLLTLDLSNWRLNREGNAGGTFAATLASDAEKLSLGLFEDSGVHWDSNAGHFTPRKGATEAEAEAAMRSLYDAVAATRLIPGVTRGQSATASE